jgi:hypothetical protein
MPTFCRHNRFVERCPICSKTLPDRQASGARAPRASRAGRAASGARTGARRPRGDGLRVQREGRAEDDGYRCELVPGLRASADASRLAQEIAFASGRLLTLAAAPPGLYGEARALGVSDLERATWMCLLIAYLAPLEGEDPFAGIRLALAVEPGTLPDLGDVPLGPRTSHAPERGTETLAAYLNWVQRTGPSQAAAFAGDPAWTPERRFERLFERLALPGLGRTGRYELLVILGRLGLYELRPDSLHVGGARGVSAEDATTLAAKRVFGIGDPLLLERRAAALAQVMLVPVETLDLALFNWAAPQRATLGFPADASDADALERAGAALVL